MLKKKYDDFYRVADLLFAVQKTTTTSGHSTAQARDFELAQRISPLTRSDLTSSFDKASPLAECGQNKTPTDVLYFRHLHKTLTVIARFTYRMV